jgi:IclR family pca regulon transcriptional regulator
MLLRRGGGAYDLIMARSRRMNDGTGATGVQSVARALGILELFQERQSALTTSDIADQTGLNRVTAYRFCQTLLHLGYLDEVSPGTYRPGLKAVSLARAALKSRELPELALPYLRRLREDTGETVNMALLDPPNIIYVSRLLSDSLLALRLFVGSRLPAHATSMGRAMLAYLPSDEVDAMLADVKLEAITSHTITNRRDLKAELRRIAERGYAVNDQEMIEGIRGIAAPVFGVLGRPAAAVNVSLTRPLSDDEQERLAAKVTEATRAISALATELAIDMG